MFKNVYFYRARLLPTLLTAIPILIFLNKVIAVKYEAALRNVYDMLPIVVNLSLSAAVVFLFVQINRLLAKEVFQRFYFREELNMPTTNTLLWKDGFYDDAIKTKIREKINEKFGILLLNKKEENDQEQRARRLTTTAVSQIRNALKGNAMLFQHNIEYGFWRNLIGGSLLAVLFSIAIFVYGQYSDMKDLQTLGGMCIIIYLLPVLLSKIIMRYFGKYYSKILYEQFLSL